MRNREENKPIISFENFALADIVMNVFIFFFISFSLLYTFNPSKIDLDLPQVPQDEPIQMPVIVSIDKDGNIYLRNEQVSSPGQLTEKLKSEGVSQQRIVIRGDKNLPYSKVNNVLVAVYAANVPKVNLAIIVEEQR